MAGLSSTGFETKRLADLKTDTEAGFRSAYGPAINLTPSGVPGKLVGLIAYGLSLIWQQLQSLYDAFVPVNATGVALDNLAAIKGLVRLDATYATATVNFYGTAGTVIPAGTQVSAGVGGDVFETLAAATLAAAVFPLGPLGTDGAIIDVQAMELGEVEAVATAINTIVTPIAGLSAVQNPAAAVPGRAREEDAELRLRMVAQAQIIGSTTVGGLLAQVATVTNVQSVRVVENDTAVALPSGQPAHSLRVVAYPQTGVTAQTLAQTIFDNKAAGIQAWGSTGPYTVTDIEGNEHEVDFDWATPFNVGYNITVTPNANIPDDAAAQIRTLLTAYVTALDVGANVTHHGSVQALATIPGMDNLQLEIGPAGGPYVEDPLTPAITDSQKARILLPAHIVIAGV